MFKTTCIAGFAMFSMFFGSGNLVFPLLLGTETLDHSLYATFGFLITAVLVPFIGLIAMIVFDGKREKFFATIGATPGFLLTFALLSLMGPFGVIPRCITVAYGGLQLIYPQLSYALFSLLFTLCIGGLIWRPNRVVNIIGVVLTPFKLGGILILIAFGLYFAEPSSAYAYTPSVAAYSGFQLGYQTMDLVAAFFFSATIVNYLRNSLINGEHKPALLKSSITASLIGASLLALVYFGFVKLGASYAGNLHSTSPEALLAAIAGLTMGKYALVIVSVTLAVSCLATAVILSSLYVSFVKEDIAENRLKLNLDQPAVIALTLAVTYLMSLLGFSKISSMLGIILTLCYPALIGLALHHILTFWVKMDYAKPIFYGVLIISGLVQWYF